MTFSFHHHLRNGDFVANMVMKAAIEELGLKDLTIAATSLGDTFHQSDTRVLRVLHVPILSNILRLVHKIL